MNYKIVSDSASNVFEIKGTDFAYVPLKIVCGEKEYVDTPELDLAGMISDLKQTKNRSGTSCPNVHEWLGAFSGADCVFAISITSGLSGSYAAAVQAKEDYLSQNPNAKVHIIDSLSAGPEMRVIIEKLQELISQELSFEDIVAKIDEYQKSTKLIFCLQSLNNLARNGRVSMAKAKIAGVLGIRVVGRASTEGTLEELYKARGAEKSLEVLFKEMQNSGYNGGKARIAHCDNIDTATNLKNLILQNYPSADVEIEDCAALCSFYAEEGGYLVGYETV